MSPKSLWKQIKDEASAYFHFEMNVDSVDGVVDAFGLQKVSLLRSFCVKTGVQVIILFRGSKLVEPLVAVLDHTMVACIMNLTRVMQSLFL